jgi:hypothetical protein
VVCGTRSIQGELVLIPTQRQADVVAHLDIPNGVLESCEKKSQCVISSLYVPIYSFLLYLIINYMFKIQATEILRSIFIIWIIGVSIYFVYSMFTLYRSEFYTSGVSQGVTQTMSDLITRIGAKCDAPTPLMSGDKKIEVIDVTCLKRVNQNTSSPQVSEIKPVTTPSSTKNTPTQPFIMMPPKLTP